jgi:hypothetical protein
VEEAELQLKVTVLIYSRYEFTGGSQRKGATEITWILDPLLKPRFLFALQGERCTFLKGRGVARQIGKTLITITAT